MSADNDGAKRRYQDSAAAATEDGFVSVTAFLGVCFTARRLMSRQAALDIALQRQDNDDARREHELGYANFASNSRNIDKPNS